MRMPKAEYKAQLYDLQVELVKCQRHIIQKGQRILLIFEGRDAGGKDGTIKRFTEHLSPRETRVVALGPPSDRERSQWYFQRYASYLPAAGEMVIFNRSWYNRAGVERVMGFCNEDELREFFDTVGGFEHMLIRSGIHLFKYYLDISKDEQRKRLKARREDPLKQWKTSPIDSSALEHWAAYSHARNDMLQLTHSPESPWTIVRADRKRPARLAVIADFLSRLDYAGKNPAVVKPDPAMVFQFDASFLDNGVLAK